MLWSNIWRNFSDIVIFKIQHRKSKVKAIHLPFIPNQLIHPIHIPFVRCHSALPFLRYGYLKKKWPGKSKFKVMGEFEGQDHIAGPTTYRLTLISLVPSIHDIHCFQDLKNSRSRSRVRSKFKVTKWVRLPIDSHPLRSMSIDPVISDIQLLQNLTLKI